MLSSQLLSQSLTLGSDIQPELDDLKIFEQDAKTEDGLPNRSMTHLTSIHKRKVILNKGDVVRVKEGELRDLLGDVDSIDGKRVIIRPRHEAIKQKLEFNMEELEKYFEAGDHVKVSSDLFDSPPSSFLLPPSSFLHSLCVELQRHDGLLQVVNGRRAGVTGTVVRVEGETIYILTDVNREEILVFSSDLQDTNEVTFLFFHLSRPFSFPLSHSSLLLDESSPHPSPLHSR